MTSPPGGTDRRTLPRVYCEQIIELRSDSAGILGTALTRDVSPRGVFFYTEQEFVEGECVDVGNLHLPSKAAGSNVRGKVIRIDRPHPNSRFGVAIALDRVDTRPEHKDDSPRQLQPSRVASCFQNRDVRVTTVLLLILILAGGATSLLVRLLRQRQVATSLQLSRDGERALASGDNQAAIDDFRAVVNLTPARSESRLQLAQALLATGRLDDAKTQYWALRDTEPDNGSVNLALARLHSRSGNSAEAQRFYHAAIAGVWPSDSTIDAQRARIELVRYLLSRHEPSQAGTELLLLAGNLPDDLPLLNDTASLLLQVGDAERALVVYSRALAMSPQNEMALIGAGQAAYANGMYLTAQRFFTLSPRQNPDVAARLEEIKNILSIYPSSKLQPGERADRVLYAWDTVSRRLASCAGISLGSMLYARTETETPKVSGELAGVYEQWQNIHSRMKTSEQRWELRNSRLLQSQIMSTAYEIEQRAAHSCGPPTGPDQALLQIAQHPEGIEQ